MVVEDVWPKKGEFSICSGLDFCRTEVPKKKKKKLQINDAWHCAGAFLPDTASK